jgi:hypothetical protein
MPLPEGRTLPLFEAAPLIADRCRVSIEEAKHTLNQAFREFSLSLFDCCGRAIDDWQYTEIDWERGSITYHGPSVIYTIDGAYLFREHLDAWIASAASVASGIGRSRRPRGPERGTVDRYGDADRELFPELTRLTREERMSVSAAAKELARAGKVSGPATAESKVKRLAERYRRECRN